MEERRKGTQSVRIEENDTRMNELMIEYSSNTHKLDTQRAKKEKE